MKEVFPLYTEKNNSSPGTCRQGQGNLPGSCGALAFPFVAMQQQDPPRYDQREALQQGTLFPGLDLPFQYSFAGNQQLGFLPG